MESAEGWMGLRVDKGWLTDSGQICLWSIFRDVLYVVDVRVGSEVDRFWRSLLVLCCVMLMVRYIKFSVWNFCVILMSRYICGVSLFFF